MSNVKGCVCWFVFRFVLVTVGGWCWSGAVRVCVFGCGADDDVDVEPEKRAGALKYPKGDGSCRVSVSLTLVPSC